MILTVILVLLGIWVVFGIVAEVIGLVCTGEFNGTKNALIIVGFGLLSLIAVCMEIQDGNL